MVNTIEIMFDINNFVYVFRTLIPCVCVIYTCILILQGNMACKSMWTPGSNSLSQHTWPEETETKTTPVHYSIELHWNLSYLRASE